MVSYLIYHPRRNETVFEDLTVFHDAFGGNEDPYVWNDKFLHTYCHITQLENVVGQVNFWISGNSYPNFTQLFCDCVFVIESKWYWKNRNSIENTDSLVDNAQAFEHHYQWPGRGHHFYKKRRRYTLKADASRSFMPQNENRKLIDILPFLNENGISTDALVKAMTSKRGSRPFRLENELGSKLYDYLFSVAAIKIVGSQISNRHPHTLSIKSNDNDGVTDCGHQSCGKVNQSISAIEARIRPIKKC
jgi:hypothetical protein